MYEFENEEMEYMGAMIDAQEPCLQMNDPGEILIDEDDERLLDLFGLTDNFIVDEQDVNDELIPGQNQEGE